MKFEDKDFEKKFIKWINSKTEEEIIQKLEKLIEEREEKQMEIAVAILVGGIGIGIGAVLVGIGYAIYKLSKD